MARVKLQTLLDRSNKNMASGTHAVVRETALEVIKRAYKEGINVQISEGHRSYARQNELYAQGRTKPGKIVTNAKGGQSWHNFGIAVDYFLTTNDGSKAVWTVNSNWRRVAQIAKGLGFEWGGDWTSFKDYPHLQMTGGYTLAQLRNGAKPKLTSKVNNPAPAPSKPSKPTTTTKWTEKSGNWTGGVLKQGDKGKQVTQLQQLLADNYYYPKKGAKNNGVDSYFGADTKNAVERYQSMHGLKVDGIAGKDTYAKLKGGKTTTKPKKSINQMAQEVIAGKHGTGHANRRKSLGISQSEYNKVRAEVNRLAGVKTGLTVEQMANKIINDKNAPTGHEARRKWLGINNATYQKVRARVNQKLR